MKPAPVPARVLCVIAALVSMLSPAAANARQGETQPAAASAAPVITVLAVQGAPQLVSADGNTSALQAESELSLGDTIVTDPGARAAVTVARAGEESADQRDLLLLGPETRVQFTVPDGQTPDASPVVVVVEQGVLRAVDRGSGHPLAMNLKTGDRTVHLEQADTLLEYDSDSDTAEHLVDHGAILIVQGPRRVRLNEGMIRSIEQGRIMGARSMEQQQWREVAQRTAVEGVEVQRPAAAKVGEQPGGPAPGDVKPAVAEPAEPVKEDYVYVRMQTSAGDIDLRLDRARAPVTVQNFMNYAKKGFYDGTIFHRVIEDFMIQGGGFDEDLNQKETDPPIENEWQNGLRNERGTIAMARLGRQPDSATAQFFINVKDNAALDQPRDGAAYAVFGEVVAGMDVVDQIRRAPTTAATPVHRDVPVEPIVIESVKEISEEDVQGS